MFNTLEWFTFYYLKDLIVEALTWNRCPIFVFPSGTSHSSEMLYLCPKFMPQLLMTVKHLLWLYMSTHE